MDIICLMLRGISCALCGAVIGLCIARKENAPLAMLGVAIVMLWLYTAI